MENSKYNFDMGQDGEHLREFYKKLLATDAKINKLKKSLVAAPSSFSRNLSDRRKRSLYSTSRFAHLKKEIKDNITRIFNLGNKPKTKVKRKKSKKDKARNRRYDNDTKIEMPTGILFEKKKLLVQYIPNDAPKFPKCSHIPSLKLHELHDNQLKHPFYKNTQRLDDLLDQFLEKKLPDIMVDPFNDQVRKDKKLKHTSPRGPIQNIFDSTTQIYRKYVTPNVKKAKKLKNEILKILKSDDGQSVSSTTESKRDYNFRHYGSEYDKKTKYNKYTTNTNYDLILSISTIMNPSEKRVTRLLSGDFLGKFPSRKLLQTEEEDEESVGYEDVKEVLSDELETHDDKDRRVDRKKRDDPQEEHQFDELKMPNPIRYTPPGVHNPNWKGPMPLYPDEINSAVKGIDVQKTQKDYMPELPVNSKDVAAELDKSENDMNDVEYIEDYLSNKYDKLVKMAQAYSDYGVLDGKKEVRNEKDQAMNDKVDHRVKMSVDKPKVTKKNFFARFKKGGTTEAEGMRFEFRSKGHAYKCTNLLSKHLKIASDERIHPHTSHFTTMLPMNPELDLIEEPTTENFLRSGKTQKKTSKKKDQHNEVGFYVNNMKRALKSINLNEESGDLDDDFKDVTIVEIVTHLNDPDYEYINKSSDILETEDLNPILIVKRSAKPIDVDSDIDMGQGNIDGLFKIKPSFSHDKNQTIVVAKNNTNLYDNNSNNTKKSSLTDSPNDEKRNEDIEIVNQMLDDNVTKYDPAEFLRMISSWFSTLAGMSIDGNSSKNNLNLDAINIISNIAKAHEATGKNITKRKNTTEIKTNDETDARNMTRDIVYPMYDSDMIDNIGHRSRVLMSFDEEHINNVNISTEKTEVENMDNKGESSTGIFATVTVVNNFVKATTNFSSLANGTTNYTTELSVDTVSTEDIRKTDDESMKENKTVVKRNAIEDSNLIFWNDIYDDEYGIQIDPLDNTMRERHSPENFDFMKKSGVWLQEKVRKLTDSVKRKSKDGFNKLYPKKEKSRNVSLGKGGLSADLHKIAKREDYIDDSDEWTGKDAFKVLTAHMKDVCKEAVQALHKTRNIEVREDNQESIVSTGLMRQLVKLMTDLVDYQVQLKTCLRLPPDLQEFLAWLMLPGPQQDRPKQFQVSHRDNILKKFDKQKVEIRPAPSATPKVQSVVKNPMPEHETNQADARSECLGTLRAVEHLIWQYDHMSEADKSKMTGIREYLQNQLIFLSNQLDKYDGSNNMYFNIDNSARYRRDLRNKSDNRRPKKRRHRHKRHNSTGSRKMKAKLGKFIKNFGKKHTRTTANNYDLLQVSTDVMKKEIVDSNADLKVKEEIEPKTDKLKRSLTPNEKRNDKVKRNLKDVYYHALAEAKKMTTIKKEIDEFDRPQIVRIQNWHTMQL